MKSVDKHRRVHVPNFHKADVDEISYSLSTLG